MKSYYTFFLVVLMFQLGCDKDNVERQVPEWSKVNVQKNGQYWVTEAVAINRITGSDTNIEIQANIANEYGFLREHLSLGNIDPLIGKQKIPGSRTDTLYSRYTTFMADGDVVEDRFVVLEDEDNFIDIQLLDMDKMEMTGIFQVTFARDPNDHITNPNLPDTFRFTEGEFHLKIIDWN